MTIPALKGRCARVAEVFEPASVAAIDGGGCLDLDGRDLAGVVLDDEIDVLAVTLAIEEAHVLLGAGGVLDQFSEHERLAGAASDRVVVSDACFVGAEEVGQQPRVAEVGLGACGFACAEPRAPSAEALDEEELLDQ
jgi:hypothetical protein